MFLNIFDMQIATKVSVSLALNRSTYFFINMATKQKFAADDFAKHTGFFTSTFSSVL